MKWWSAFTRGGKPKAAAKVTDRSIPRNRNEKIEEAAKDFASRFENVMRDLAKS